jgi:hypothetical protein
MDRRLTSTVRTTPRAPPSRPSVALGDGRSMYRYQRVSTTDPSRPVGCGTFGAVEDVRICPDSGPLVTGETLRS